jgi:hypothetical protein
MLPKATWPPSPIEELDRTMHGAPSDWGDDKKWTEGQFPLVTDKEIDDLVTKIEREYFAHV